MQWLFHAIEELTPVIVFFVLQSRYDFVAGVIAMTVATVLLLGYAFLTKRGVPKFAVISTVSVLLFVVPTILTGESWWFQISDTILDGLFALLLLGSLVIKRPLLKLLFDRIFAITDEAWWILTVRWGILFLVLAILNEYIRMTYTDDVWSWFKLGSTIFVLLFGCYQFTLSRRMRIEGESNSLGLRTNR